MGDETNGQERKAALREGKREKYRTHDDASIERMKIHPSLTGGRRRPKRIARETERTRICATIPKES